MDQTDFFKLISIPPQFLTSVAQSLDLCQYTLIQPGSNASVKIGITALKLEKNNSIFKDDTTCSLKASIRVLPV